ncbi:hypothetical protein [Legionella israelensis]|uniref:Coiled coil domain-containing protein n=1 Tax=Legionella israelensis TaxID=454 RepID=A0A0W0WBJ8_9GAMM|nr:hypothetical protein [Legionella israelensis]KTD29723.1 coiled coil domain-containing protein [Legionella israelensis]QBS08851.1 hypothetical protein E4T55_02620 [Legionella israelensis]SCY02126.1 hypothetical protein SAMN02746069_01008 [Legionella israelensis DSM 19235]STX58534.1 coiled coil domain protein [Legionella israelensis]
MGILYKAGKALLYHSWKGAWSLAGTNNKVFTPDERKKLFEEHQDLIGIGPASFNESVLKDYNSSRTKDYRGFAQIKLPDGSNIGEKLKKTVVSGEANNVRDTLAGVFEQTSALKNGLDDYDKGMKEIEKLRQEVGKTLSAEDLVNKLKNIGNGAKKSLSEQQKAEKDKLEKLFDDSNFVDNLKNSLNLSDDEEVKKIKKEMLDTLDKKHAEEKKNLEVEIAKNEVNLHKAAQKEINERLFIALMYKNYPESMKKKIEDIANEKNPRSSTIQVGMNDNGIDLSGVTLDDLTKAGLETVRGRPLSYDKDTNTFSIHFANRWREPGLSIDPRNTYRNEIKSVVQAVKATGSTGISLKVDFKDEEVAKQRARQSVLAALEAGFHPKGITINMPNQGKTYKMDDKGGNPFKDFMSDSEWNAALKKYEKDKKIQDNIGPKNNEDYKNNLKLLKSAKPKEKSEEKKSESPRATM